MARYADPGPSDFDVFWVVFWGIPNGFGEAFWDSFGIFGFWQAFGVFEMGFSEKGPSSSGPSERRPSESVLVGGGADLEHSSEHCKVKHYIAPVRYNEGFSENPGIRLNDGF